MKDVRKTTSSISMAILILGSLYATMLLGSLFVTPVAAADVLYTPIDQTINATEGENFTLPFLMRFNETDEGFFSVTFYWDVNETDPSGKYWNFTYESHIAKFVDNTAFSGAINVSIDKEVPYGYPSGYYRYTVQVFEAYGEAYGTDTSPQNFWVNVTMRAAGQGASYINHTAGEQNVTIVRARSREATIRDVGPGNVTINVIGITVIDAAVVEVKTFSSKHSPAGDGTYGFPKPLTPVNACYSTWTVEINVTVINNGTAPVTFTVFAFAGNATGNYTIGSAVVTDLTPGATTTRKFTWDVPDIPKVWPYWTYTIYGNATVTTLPGDMRPTNNVKVANVVIVKWLGDVSPPAGDGHIVAADFGVFARSYKKPPESPRYNPQCDLTGEGEVTAADFGVFARNYKKGPLD